MNAIILNLSCSQASTQHVALAPMTGRQTDRQLVRGQTGVKLKQIVMVQIEVFASRRKFRRATPQLRSARADWTIFLSKQSRFFVHQRNPDRRVNRVIIASRGDVTIRRPGSLETLHDLRGSMESMAKKRRSLFGVYSSRACSLII